MQAVMMAALTAAGLGTAAQAATTVQASLTVDQLVGYFDQFEENSLGSDIGVSLVGTLPSVDVVEFGEGRNWTYSLVGTMELDFLGSLVEFAGQISGGLNVFIDRGPGDEERSADMRYSTSFAGISEDGALVEFMVSGFAPGDGGFGGPAFDVGDAEALIARLDRGNFIFDTTLGGDLTISLSLFGAGVEIGNQPGSRYDSISNLPQYVGSPSRMAAASGSISSPVPLPASGSMLAPGILGLTAAGRRKT